jgi:hypothetical protein
MKDLEAAEVSSLTLKEAYRALERAQQELNKMRYYLHIID